MSIEYSHTFACLPQPPKKKGGKKGKKGKKKSAKSKTPTVIDGVSTEEMSKEQVTEQSKADTHG